MKRQRPKHSAKKIRRPSSRKPKVEQFTVFEIFISIVKRGHIAANLLLIALSCSLLLSMWFESVTPLAVGVLILCSVALITCLFLFTSQTRKWPWQQFPVPWVYVVPFAILIAAGLYIRYPISTHIHGGQDQGSYFNVAAWVAQHGTFRRKDPILADAFTNQRSFASFLVVNPYKRRSGERELFIPGEYEGERFIGGFEISDRKRGIVTPQFYPLTALLLATNFWIFGLKGIGYILPIIGVLAVVGAALLAHQIWKISSVTIFVFIILLTSGLQVFFSGFPVSEMISQYFIITGLWLLTWGVEEKRQELSLLAGVNFSLALFNHVSVIFYVVPVVAYLVLCGIMHRERAELKSAIVFYYTFLVGAALSLVSARVFNGYYVYRVLKSNLGFFETLGLDGTFALVFGSIVVAALVPVVFYTKAGAILIHRQQLGSKCIIVIVGLTTTLIVVKTVLYQSDMISSNIDYTYFASITSHLSLLGWIGLLWGLLRIARSPIELRIVCPILALSWFAFLFLYLRYSTGYQWYFDRYYVKELYPLIIIFAVFGIIELRELKWLQGLRGNVLVGILLGTLIVFNSYPMIYIFKKPYLDGALEQAIELNTRLSEHSIVLFVQGRGGSAQLSYNRLASALVYSFGHDVVWIPLRSDLKAVVGMVSGDLRTHKRAIYLLYTGSEPLPPNMLPKSARMIGSQLHEFTEPELSFDVPKERWTLRMPIHIYSL